jgi:hypothetical protein
MKTFLPWIVAVLALGGAYYFYNANRYQRAELVKLQTDVVELENLRTEIVELKSQHVSADEVAQLRKDKDDLLRLRNEVRQLRDDKQQLTRQAQTAQASVQRAQAESQRIQEQAQAQAQSQAALLARTQDQTQGLINACINNLRQLDGAKQQWALENNKQEQDVPAAQDIAPFLKDGALPVCPAGGQYTLNAVGAVPTCSVVGHALPK